MPERGRVSRVVNLLSLRHSEIGDNTQSRRVGTATDSKRRRVILVLILSGVLLAL